MIVHRLLFIGLFICAAAQASVILDNTYVFSSPSDLGTVDVEVIVEDNYLGNPNVRNWTYAVHNINFVPYAAPGFPTVAQGFLLPWAPSQTAPGCPPDLCGFELHTPPGWSFSVRGDFPGSWTALGGVGLPPGSTVEFGFATTSQGIVHVSHGSSVFAVDYSHGGPGDQVIGNIDIPSTPPAPIPEPSTLLMVGTMLSLAVLIGGRRMPPLIKRVANRSGLAVRSNR